MNVNKSGWLQTGTLFVASYLVVAVLAGLFGWLIGAGGLIVADHRLVSLFAGIAAPASLLGIVAVATVRSFASTPTPSLWAGSAATPPGGDFAPMSPDEPSHIHIPRPSKGERA